jgi:hypothetical protein
MWEAMGCASPVICGAELHASLLDQAAHPSRMDDTRQVDDLPPEWLEYRPPIGYCLLMDDTPRHTEVPAEWLEALARSEADLKAGRIVSGEEVLRDLDEALKRMEAKRARNGASRRIAKYR